MAPFTSGAARATFGSTIGQIIETKTAEMALRMS